MKKTNNGTLNILFVSEYFYPRLAGAEVWSWELCTFLAKKGHRVTVITSRIGDHPAQEQSNGITILRPVRSGTGRARRTIAAAWLARYVANYLNHHQPDIVHVVAYALNVAVSKAAAKKGIPCVTAVHSYFGENWKKIADPISARLLSTLEQSSIVQDKSIIMHCPSQYTQRLIHSDTTKSVKVIHNWIPDVETLGKKVQDKELRKLLQGSYLFVGSLEPVKRPLECIAICKKAKVPLVIIGTGTLEESIRDAAARQDVRVIMLGNLPRQQTISCIATAKLVLVPSVTESFSLVAVEAIAQQVPVAGNPVGIISELPGVVSLGVKKIPKISASQAHEVRERFDKETIISQILELYKDVKTNKMVNKPTKR